jgi:hypothetical protein
MRYVHVWDDEVMWWYAQNTIVFVRDSAVTSYPRRACLAATDPAPDPIHPRNYERLARFSLTRSGGAIGSAAGSRLFRGRRPD